MPVEQAVGALVYLHWLLFIPLMILLISS